MSRFTLFFLLLSLLSLSSPLYSHARDATPSSPSPSSSNVTSSSSTNSSHADDYLPPHLRASPQQRRDTVDDDAEPSPAHNSSSHSFHTLQAAPTYFQMTRLSQFAPWSPRIQPAVLLMYKPTQYVQHLTNIAVSTGSPWLILFEGTLTYQQGGQLVNENDVWASADGGRTWDLMAGISRFGRSYSVVNNMTAPVPSAQPSSSFFARRGANNCEDPDSDYIFSIGGVDNSIGLSTNQVWYSSDGKTWRQQDSSETFAPNRYFSSCDLDKAGHIYTLGGVNTDQNTPNGRLLNDVWSSSIVTGLRQWRLITARAQWSPRAEHLVLVGDAPVLQKEIIYVIGGITSWVVVGNELVQRYSNDVWASSDGGLNWIRLEDAGFAPRWGHGGLITSEGVLLVFGGADSTDGTYAAMYQYRDVWASFDGGRSWGQCSVGTTAGQSTWIRTESGVTLNSEGHLLSVAGYAFGAVGQGGRTDFNDVWVSSFSVEGAAGADTLATLCNSVVPPRGIGLREWRGESAANTNVFSMTVQTRRAPWSARASPALLLMTKPITYKQAGSRVTVSTTPNWLLMYEGALPSEENGVSQENDVWASADYGVTWDLISGISMNGAKGYQRSEMAESSFPHRSRSNNCEDPANDDVYSIGGLYDENSISERSTNEVWFSTNAMEWQRRSGLQTSFTPNRYDSSCDVDTAHVLYIAGGRQYPGTAGLLNDVWYGTNQGRNWLRATARAPWRARAQHLVIIYNSIPMGRTFLYVMGGISRDGSAEVTLENDVWASSDGGVSWAVITGNAPWNKRWGHTGAIADNGLMVLLGGTTAVDGSVAAYTALKDLWLSLDGGYTCQPLTHRSPPSFLPAPSHASHPFPLSHLVPFPSPPSLSVLLCCVLSLSSAGSQCDLPSDHGFIRGQMGTALAADQRLILASGYSWQNGISGNLRTDFTDLWISDISLGNAQRMSDVCQGFALPSAGTGLRMWPGTYVAPSNPTLSAIAIAGIVTLLIVLVATVAFCYWSKKTTGRYPIPTFLQPTPRPAQPVGNGDYFVPGTGGSLGGGGGFGSSTSGPKGGGSDAFSTFENSAADEYRPPTGGYAPPGSNGRDGHHSLLS